VARGLRKWSIFFFSSKSSSLFRVTPRIPLTWQADGTDFLNDRGAAPEIFCRGASPISEEGIPCERRYLAIIRGWSFFFRDPSFQVENLPKRISNRMCENHFSLPWVFSGRKVRTRFSELVSLTPPSSGVFFSVTFIFLGAAPQRSGFSLLLEKRWLCDRWCVPPPPAPSFPLFSYPHNIVFSRPHNGLQASKPTPFVTLVKVAFPEPDQSLTALTVLLYRLLVPSQTSESVFSFPWFPAPFLRLKNVFPLAPFQFGAESEHIFFFSSSHSFFSPPFTWQRWRTSSSAC